MTSESITMVTCTYAPDALRAQRLCRSVDRFVPENIPHCLVVPSSDLASFSHLRSGRRSVVAVEDILPDSFHRVPYSTRWWIQGGYWPVRGWIMQQLTKLSANAVADSEIILFADSDVTFFRPLDEALYVQAGKTRLHRVPHAAQDKSHLRWHRKASELLGEEECDYFGSDYIGQLITWRRDNLERLQQHLESIHGQSWQTLVSRSLHFSEYILYGVFVEHVMGLQGSGHFFCEDSACHCCWFQDEADALLGGKQLISAKAHAVLLQSNLGLSIEAEADFLKALPEASNIDAHAADLRKGMAL